MKVEPSSRLSRSTGHGNRPDETDIFRIFAFVRLENMFDEMLRSNSNVLPWWRLGMRILEDWYDSCSADCHERRREQ